MSIITFFFFEEKEIMSIIGKDVDWVFSRHS